MPDTDPVVRRPLPVSRGRKSLPSAGASVRASGQHGWRGGSAAASELSLSSDAHQLDGPAGQVGYWTAGTGPGLDSRTAEIWDKT